MYNILDLGSFGLNISYLFDLYLALFYLIVRDLCLARVLVMLLLVCGTFNIGVQLYNAIGMYIPVRFLLERVTHLLTLTYDLFSVYAGRLGLFTITYLFNITGLNVGHLRSIITDILLIGMLLGRKRIGTLRLG